MDPATALTKTPKGVEEIETRKHKLEPRLRSLLIVVNGKMSAGELADRFGQLGDVATMLEVLLKEGFIQGTADEGERLSRARVELARLVAERLGGMGDDIAIKIEQTKTLEELRAYLEARHAILDQALGKSGAAAFWAKAASLLG